MTPVIMTIASHFEIAKIFDGHFNAQTENQQSFVYLLALSFFWFISQTWITLHIWSPAEISNELVSDTKWYNSLLIDQSMSFSPTRHHDKVSESTKCSMMKRVFAVATMWHETSDEMLIILKSIFHMDKDQSSRHLARYCNNKVGCFQLFVIALDSREYFCLIRLSILIAITTRPTSFSTPLSNRTRKMAQPRESSTVLSIN